MRLQWVQLYQTSILAGLVCRSCGISAIGSASTVQSISYLQNLLQVNHVYLGLRRDRSQYAFSHVQVIADDNFLKSTFRRS